MRSSMHCGNLGSNTLSCRRHRGEFGARSAPRPGSVTPARDLPPNYIGATPVPDDLTAAPTDLHWLTIADAARLIERRRVSPVELTDALIARVEALDPHLDAFLLPTPEMAREQAKTAERELMAGDHRGPLHRIPVAPEGLCATPGSRTTRHTKTHDNP